MSILTFKNRSRFVTAAIFGAMLGFAAPAWGTEIREAVRLCDKNPNCDYRIGGADGGMDFQINGVTVVSCPPNGQCTCVSNSCGAQRASGQVKGGTLAILSAPKGTAIIGQKPGIGKPRPAPKAILGGGILETGSGFNSNAPAATGAPATSAPVAAPIKLY